MEVRRRPRVSSLVAALVLGLVALVLVTGCGGSDSDSTGTEASSAGTGTAAADAELTPLNVSVFPVTANAPILVADEQGIFKKNGLDVKWEFVSDPAAAGAAVVSGKLDVGNAAPPGIIQGIAQGLPVKIIANIGFINDTEMGIIVKADGPIQDFGGLAGKTVANSQVQGSGTLGIAKALQDAGHEPDDVKVIAVPLADSAQAVESGRVDAAVLPEPFLSQVKNDPKFRVLMGHLDPAKLGYRIPSSVFYAADKTIAAKPDALVAFNESLEEASTILTEDPELTRTVVPEIIPGLKPEQVADITLPIFDASLEAFNEAYVPEAEQMAELGWIPEAPSVDEAVWSGN